MKKENDIQKPSTEQSEKEPYQRKDGLAVARAFTTSDGKAFTDRDEARKHQKNLSRAVVLKEFFETIFPGMIAQENMELFVNTLLERRDDLIRAIK